MARKRETDGKYAHEGDWDRLCVCGHTLGVHGAGSPADCLLYSFSPDDLAANSDTMRKQLSKETECGCVRFRLSRSKPKVLRGDNFDYAKHTISENT